MTASKQSHDGKLKEKERAFRIILGPALGVRNPA
jgi:hypothetical protein